MIGLQLATETAVATRQRRPGGGRSAARVQALPVHLSGPFQELPADDQGLAILSLLELRGDIGLADPRTTVPAMVDLAGRHPRLNLPNLEAVATARLPTGTIWLSEQGSEAILPPVLDAEGIAWRTVEC